MQELSTSGPHTSSNFTPLDILILENRESARKIAGKLLRAWHIHLSADEVNSIVDITLCESAARFDPTRGTQLSTYYFYYLRGHLISTIRQNVSSAKVSRAALRCASMHSSCGRPEERESNDQDEIENFARQMRPEDLGLREIATPEEVALHREQADCIHKAVATLDFEEQVIIRGLHFRNQKIQTIAQQLGCSRSHIKRLQSRALAKLRSALTTSASAGVNPQVEKKAEIINIRTAHRRSSRRRRFQRAHSPAMGLRRRA